MAFTLEDAERMYTKAMDDADKGDYSAHLFVKYCDPFDFVDDNGKTDDAFRTDPGKNAFIFTGGPAGGKSKVYDDDIEDDVEALKELMNSASVNYAEMHREEKALLKVKRRGRKKQREKNRRLRENRDKELREKKRLLRKKVAEKNGKKKQSKRERKRFSPMSKDMRMLHDSIKDGFALK